MAQEIPQPKKSKAVFWFIVVIILLFVFSGGLFFMSSFMSNNNTDSPELENAIANAEERFSGNTNNQATNTSMASNDNNNTNRVSNASIAGTWTSDCLVPDQNSPWSEKHRFVISADGTAVHTRWSGSDHNCTVGDTLVNNYSYTMPQPGQINLTDRDLGSTLYDIYQISNSTLKFGHGFQSPYPAGYDATQGNSSTNRFHDLNNYIVYKK
ncbi:MAG: hypothetical protein WCT27_01340 [Patescibacteria group bacterium]|jgi:hypothetical protein